MNFPEMADYVWLGHDVLKAALTERHLDQHWRHPTPTEGIGSCAYPSCLDARHVLETLWVVAHELDQRGCALGVATP